MPVVIDRVRCSSGAWAIFNWYFISQRLPTRTDACQCRGSSQQTRAIPG